MVFSSSLHARASVRWFLSLLAYVGAVSLYAFPVAWIVFPWLRHFSGVFIFEPVIRVGVLPDGSEDNVVVLLISSLGPVHSAAFSKLLLG